MPLTKTKIRWGYLIAFLLLLVSYFLIFYIIREQTSEATRVSHSHTVINNLESIKSEITDAETGVRGYILTKDVRFLRPYNSGSKNVGPLYRELKALVNDNPRYWQKSILLGSLIERRLDSLASSVENFQRAGNVLTEQVGRGRFAARIMMDSIRLLVNDLKQQEQSLMKFRNDRLRGFYKGTEIITITSLVIALITIFYSLITYNKENKAKEVANKNARAYSLELEERVKELKKVNAELEELRRIEKFAATGRIARTIAHEVRNPLTNISLAAEQLKEMAAEKGESELLLEMISRNVVRINQLVSDLLNSTRFAQLEYSPSDIHDLLDETLELAADRIELNRIKVEKYYEKGLCDILVDKEKMKLAFLNIIVNAIEAMKKESGVLQIKTRKLGDKCMIEFRDNGTGMDSDTLNKLFEPYFTGKSKGSGLGLTNTQNIILNHKGSIHVKSEPGVGSTFIVMLNFAQEAADEA